MEPVWTADCFVQQSVGWRGLALRGLAYTGGPGEDGKSNVSRVRVMGEKASHVFIRETHGVEIIKIA